MKQSNQSEMSIDNSNNIEKEKNEKNEEKRVEIDTEYINNDIIVILTDNKAGINLKSEGFEGTITMKREITI